MDKIENTTTTKRKNNAAKVTQNLFKAFVYIDSMNTMYATCEYFALTCVPFSHKFGNNFKANLITGEKK